MPLAEVNRGRITPPGSLTEEAAMLRRATITVAVLALLRPLAAQPRQEADISVKIREEESSHSQIMRTLHFLADVYGPRVTGSPSLKAAGEWAIKTMEGWGFTNGRLEP